MKINIKGVDKVKLLAALFNAAGPEGPTRMTYKPRHVMSKHEAHEWLERHYEMAATPHIYYIEGRRINLDISGDKVDPYAWDKRHGWGAFSKIVNSLPPQPKKPKPKK